MSLRDRVLDWATAIVVAIGVVASIPMLPILLIGWLVLMVRSPTGGLGVIGATRAAADDAAPGKLEGFNGSWLFPMVAAGWFLIALVAAGFLSGDPTQPDSINTGLFALIFLVLLVGPTLLVYRSMYPATRLDEWLGSRDYGWVGRLGVPLVATIATFWLIWSITTWTTFLGGWWTAFCMFVLASSPIVLPAFILIGLKRGRSLYMFIGVATVVGLVSVGAYYAGLTSPPWP